MSSIMIVVAKGLDVEKISSFEMDITSFAHSIGIGIWTKRQFCESFEKIYSAEKDNFIFSIADNEIYDNCEDLVSPWWFCDSCQEQFEYNFSRIAKIMEFCLAECSSVELFLGTSGDQYEDFCCEKIPLSKFVFTVTQHYSQSSVIPPSIHFIMKKE